jgi:2-polyprenyl-3-methyl-5-hydroxy-6-metoxy-1,4-benzoquinol methylase
MSQDVKQYFERQSGTFDALYGEGAERLFNRIFRRPLYERFRLTMDELSPFEGKRFLDVGCGSGIYAVELAKRGARVVGVDFSEEMIKLSKERARSAGISEQCEFLHGDFTAVSFPGQFDASYAMGVFDYARDPRLLLKSMKTATRGKILASFPSPTLLRMPLRKIRYALRGCPVFFYTLSQLKKLFESTGMANAAYKKLGPGWFVVADAGNSPQRS